MRQFNTSGPCDPAKHYTVMREALVAEGQVLVDQGRYFTIFSPRQAGKTTYFQLLFRQLQPQGYLPVWISFEGLKTLGRQKFYEILQEYLTRELAEYGIQVDVAIEDQTDFQKFITQIETTRRLVADAISKLLNNGIRSIIRRAFGFHSFHNFRLQVLVELGDLPLPLF